MLRTGNPVLNDRTFESTARWDELQMERSTSMTVGGTVSKTTLMLGFCVASAILSWTVLSQNGGLLMPVAFGGAIVGLLLAFVIMFVPRAAPYLCVPYAICEGAFVGGISLIYAAWAGAAAASAAQSGGPAPVTASLDVSILFQAVLLTFGISAAAMIAYGTRIIRVSDSFVKFIFMATSGYVFLMLATFILRMFVPIPYIFETGAIGLAISAGVVVLATMNLLANFKVIENGVAARAPKYMEWIGALGVLVTIVWLYVSLLRLLAMLRPRD